MLRNLVCSVLGHRVDRRRVWNDGIDFRTACARCGTPMLRDPGGWRLFHRERDDHPARKNHPREH